VSGDIEHYSNIKLFSRINNQPVAMAGASKQQWTGIPSIQLLHTAMGNLKRQQSAGSDGFSKLSPQH